VLSDGASVTDIPSRLVDIEKLGMFAAPRSSAERTHGVLQALVAEHGGVAFWIALEGDRLFCFDRVGEDAAADPGFAAGGFPEVARTRIAHAVPPGSEGVATRPDGSRPTVLVPILGRRGHSLGMVGLTLPRLPPGFDAAELRQHIAAELGGTADQEARALSPTA
jgi:hypothetical protein